MPEIVKAAIAGGRSLERLQAAFAEWNPGLRFDRQDLDGEWMIASTGVTYSWIESGAGQVWLEQGYRTQEGDGAPLPLSYVADAVDRVLAGALAALGRDRQAIAPAALPAVDSLLSRFDGRVFAGDPMGDFWGLREACGDPDRWAAGEARDALLLVLRQAGALGWATKAQSGWESLTAGDQVVATRHQPVRGRGRVRLWSIEDTEVDVTHCSATRRLAYLRDTAGGCAPGFDAYRRLPLTWYTEPGAVAGDGRNRLNSHVVNIAAEQSRTHYHPASAAGGGKPQCELYLVLDPKRLGLSTAGRQAMLHSFPEIHNWSNHEVTPLQPGDVVLIPPGTGHRGLDVFTNVVTLPGFKPGNEVYVDAAIAAATAGAAPHNPLYAESAPAQRKAVVSAR
jgi:hypothetical protein